MKYNKLVRDMIPAIIRGKGGLPKTHVAGETEYRAKLLEKLGEEVKEFAEEPSAEEFADIREVLEAVREHFGFDESEISKIQSQKATERGRFRGRIILDES